ncbi:uncharacterized protein LOC133654370 [Entelurus aequoreus]|uniref:uncharacterized protein LOC133654370 n=1 Tax=Entelurus aequoreus TaxID=161455 RepID=UPI002B1D1EC7|nr:uncharacterized protein LOC133654370 [Entelurus aequoreus]
MHDDACAQHNSLWPTGSAQTSQSTARCSARKSFHRVPFGGASGLCGQLELRARERRSRRNSSGRKSRPLVIKEEFRRITTIPLERTFMHKLDEHTPKRITQMKAKGGAVGIKMRPLLDRLSQKQSILMRRETIIRSLILYLGEKEEELFEDCLEDSRSDVSNHILKILVVHGTDEDPVDVSILTSGLPVINVFHFLSNKVSVNDSKDCILQQEWLDTLSCLFLVDSVDFIS